MKVERDYEKLLGLFNNNRVRYCIVGAYAVAFHGLPRYTKDIDILVESNSENAQRIIKALEEFGFKNVDLSGADFTEEGKIIQLGFEPVRIDIITSIEGCSFKEVWKNKKTFQYGSQKVFFIGIKELIKNKKVSNRKQDQIDLEAILKINKEVKR